MSGMAQEMAQEIELKFRLGPRAAARLAAHPALAGEDSVQSLRSVYFDTPDQALRRAGWGLRVRATGRGFVQTLKGQTGGDVLNRAEWETPVPSEALDWQAVKTTPAAALLKGRRRDLSPRFASTVRRRARLVAFEGAVIEAAYDEGELSAGGRVESLRELELELKDGPPQALFALARRLSADVALVPLFESKAERGWRWPRDRSARRAPPSPIPCPAPCPPRPPCAARPWPPWARSRPTPNCCAGSGGPRPCISCAWACVACAPPCPCSPPAGRGRRSRRRRAEMAGA